MDKIDAVVIDDEKSNVILLERLILKYCPAINLVGSAFTREDAKHLIDLKKPKIIFLDIELDKGTGFDLIEELTHKKAKIIFVTSHSDYAIKAFKYNAIDYVLKPIEVSQLVLATNKGIEDVEKDIYTNNDQIDNFSKTFYGESPNNFIAIPTIDRIIVIKLNDILYLKSDGRYTIFHLENGDKLIASRNIGEYEEIIDKSQFFRIHNSFIVNLKFVVTIHKNDGFYCEMTNRELLQVSRRRQNPLSYFLKIK